MINGIYKICGYYICLSSSYEYKIISINIKIAYTYTKKCLLLNILTKNKCCGKLVVKMLLLEK